jgi:antitoxin MazE
VSAPGLCNYNVITVSGRKFLRTRLVQIGNSRGIRLPKTVLEEAQLEGEVELKAEPGCIIIRSVKSPRMGWEEAAREMKGRGEDRLIDTMQPTHFDRKEWKWR